MQINGEWYPCDDGVIRPTIVADVCLANEATLTVRFLIDTAADRTVFDAALLPLLQPLGVEAPTDETLMGVGGVAAHLVVPTAVLLTREDGRLVRVRGRFAVFTEPESADMPVLGRDVLDNFAVIVDRPGHCILLLAPPHWYRLATTQPGAR